MRICQNKSFSKNSAAKHGLLPSHKVNSNNLIASRAFFILMKLLIHASMASGGATQSAEGGFGRERAGGGGEGDGARREGDCLKR